MKKIFQKYWRGALLLLVLFGGAAAIWWATGRDDRDLAAGRATQKTCIALPGGNRWQTAYDCNSDLVADGSAYTKFMHSSPSVGDTLQVLFRKDEPAVVYSFKRKSF